MSDTIEMHALDAPPDAETIAELRAQSASREAAVGVTFPGSKGSRNRLVVSPRGTCVLLDDTREDTFNRSVDAEEIAASLRA